MNKKILAYAFGISDDRPLLVGWIGAFSLFAIVPALFMLYLAFFSSSYGFQVNGEPVSRADFLRALYPTLLALPLLAAAGWGILQAKSWGRALFFVGTMALYVLPQFFTPASMPWSAIARQLGALAVSLGVLWWYFYRKENVVAYFAGARQNGQNRS